MTAATGPVIGHRQIGPFGTVARAVAEAALLIRAGSRGPTLRDIALGLVVVPVGVATTVRIRTATAPDPIRATGISGHIANLGLIGTLFYANWTAASWFYGSSLLVAALRGYAACEMFAVSNWLYDRDDRLGCPVFFPIDQLER